MAHRWAHNIESRVSGHLWNHIFRSSKCRRVNQRKQDTLDRRLSLTLKNNIFRWPKCVRGWHEASYPGVEDFRKGISTNNYGGTMPKIFIFFHNFKITKVWKHKKFLCPFFGLLLGCRGHFWNSFVAWVFTKFLHQDVSPTLLVSFFTVIPKDLTTIPRSRLDYS
jgi:hypothetical protein